jgi:hypothetical protein
VADDGSSWHRRLLGDNDSWRRIIVYGIGAGLALAVVAALIAAVAGDGGDSGSLDAPTPGPVNTSGGPVETPIVVDTPAFSPTPPPIDVPPTDIPLTQPGPPTEPPPTDAPPTAPPTDLPPTEPPAVTPAG